MSDTPTERLPEAKRSHKRTIILTVLATLAFLLVLDKLLVMVSAASYQVRAKRSEALLEAQEQRSKQYQDYLRSLEVNHKRYEAILAKQEEDIARFAKILDSWERQQHEYQTYLDSLKKPQ
jgi:septal ring factor EnvC (AmiA/AmiB activator)